MEIFHNITPPNAIQLFKIDLIVWKFAQYIGIIDTDNLFKIDLIVWK